MSGLIRRLLPARRESAVVDHRPVTIDEVLEMVTFNGVSYPLFQQTLIGNSVSISPDFVGVVRGAYKANPIVFSAIDHRQALFSEATFKYRQRRNGRPGDLFGTQDLELLERPWPGATTGDLLALAEVNVSCAGNFFCARRPMRRQDIDTDAVLRSLRPDWTAIVLGAEDDVDALDEVDVDVLGYVHKPGGPGADSEPITLLPEEVAHYMPRPDPEAPWRGMSWITPVLNEIAADRQTTEHKRKYLDAGATPNLAVKLEIKDPDVFDKWVAKFRKGREGLRGNPYKTLFLAAGADPVVIGANLRDLDFSKVQGAGEVRIASAAGVPPAVLAISEGLQGAALNAGNFEAAFRQFADTTMRNLWRNFASSMARIITVPADAELWYDARDIAALAEDSKKRAEIQQQQAATINTLITAGYTPESVVDAVVSDDLRRLVHTGMTSVQLLPPGATNGNGNGNAARVALTP